MTQLAWLGLGNMGRGCARNLAQRGNLDKPLILWNRTTSRAEQLAEKIGDGKAIVSKSIEEAVKDADIIFTCVADDKAIKEAIQTATKVDVKDKIFVDCSTVEPDTTNGVAKFLQEKGASFVASPVFGPPAMAESGQLVFVLAGPEELIAKVKPYTKGVMGRATIEFPNEEPGKAELLKIAGNTFILNMVETIGQGLTMAEKTGLGTDNLYKFIELFFPGAFQAYADRMMRGDYHKKDPLFAVDLAIKDASHALSLANAVGAKMPHIEIAKSHLEAVKDHQGESGDIASIYGANRKESGLKFEN